MNQKNSATTDVLLGTIAGCLATAPMTSAMQLMHRQLPARERYPLPPRQITMKVAEEAGIKTQLDEIERVQLTTLAHFGFGASMGALYGPMARQIPLPAPVAGALFGLGVWAGNYLGLLPAMGILRPATEHPPHRNALMIAAHVVWGASEKRNNGKKK